MLSSIAVPSSCFTQTWVTTPPGDYNPGLIIGNPYDTGCFPVAYGATVSPAQCPNGYSSACAPTSILIPGETVYDCCPNGYSCDGGFFKCTSAIGRNITMTVTDVNSAQKPTLVTSVTNGMNAHSIRVRFASSDLESTTTSSGSNTAIPSSTATLPSSTSSYTSSPQSSPTASGDLSTGAKAGIGVGVALGALLLFGLVWFIFKRRSKNTKNAVELENSPYNRPTPSPRKYPSELSSAGPHVVHEMDSPRQRFELPSSTPLMK
ncbi:hypothetical protein BKA67DRAFT_530432 [Truncatella angustata]|uniref:Uncharacterized protein n=1 Tax=Truncatella angustata TaxID=152316 RepID=A0A9P8UXR7_9PEZI|nr:uncharacterized protein BKA67DRAFT_530432 [Truncatella angustata]KAH6660328.1 hypothetical protein BKA67DRAFT_530432 [Truncatella angustata]